MSLVENILNQISTQGLGGITSPQNFDLDDDTFAKLLEKQRESSLGEVQQNTIGQMGMPAGLVIEPFDGVEFSDTLMDQLEATGEKNLTNESKIIDAFEMKDVDMGDYFSNLLRTSDSEKSDLMNFARKHASNTYGNFAKSFVTDITEFAQDIASNL